MELTVHGKQIDVGDALRTHVTDKIEDLNQKYFDHAAFATVIFSREGHGRKQTKTHIQIQLGKNIMVMSDAVENDPYVSFEAAANKVAKQLRRYKRKLRDHHDRMEATSEQDIILARDYVLKAASEQDDEPEEIKDPVIIAEMTTNVQTMSVSEAVMRMDLSGDQALMFSNASHGRLNVIYRRSDGNIGWIDPENNT
ncbi:MAG: ribosome-associated translation inhibitor RaiA [Alphaproteobacteria bacterium]|nr:ribosome-associated translation inhibitor RaiA [Alphaproteobacteria bacterium]